MFPDISWIGRSPQHIPPDYTFHQALSAQILDKARCKLVTLLGLCCGKYPLEYIHMFFEDNPDSNSVPESIVEPESETWSHSRGIAILSVH